MKPELTIVNDCYLINCNNNDGFGCTLERIQLDCNGTCMYMKFGDEEIA